jgi:hypothetical protein
MVTLNMLIPFSASRIQSTRRRAIGNQEYVWHEVIEDMLRPGMSVLNTYYVIVVGTLKRFVVFRLIWDCWNSHASASAEECLSVSLRYTRIRVGIVQIILLWLLFLALFSRGRILLSVGDSPKTSLRSPSVCCKDFKSLTV